MPDPPKGKQKRGDAPKPPKKEEPEIEMKPGDYRVQIHVLEGKDLKPANPPGGGGFFSDSSGSADPMVEAVCKGEKKQSKVQYGTLAPLFNDVLFFQLTKLDEDDLDNTTIEISCYNHKMLMANALIGTFMVDMQYLYKYNQEHEVYRVWIALFDPNDSGAEIKGYLKVTMSVLGPGDKPTVHDPTKGLKSKDDHGKDKLFSPGGMDRKPYQVKLNIFRAEHLAPLDLEQNTVDPYIKVNFAGQHIESKTIDNNRNPEFNQALMISTVVPCMNGNITCEIWDDDIGKDERVGTWYIPFKKWQGKKTPVTWSNLYGPSLTVGGDYADLMTKYGDKGSHYRGRILWQLESFDEKNPKTKTEDLKFTFPTNPSPNPPEKFYILRLALYQGVELPEYDKLTIVVSCGPYEAQSETVKWKNGRCMWNQFLPDLRIRAPAEIDQIPDVFIYLRTPDGDDACFIRMKAKDILDTKKAAFEIEKIKFEEDKAIDDLDDEEFPGFLFTRLCLYSNEPPERPEPSSLFLTSGYEDYTLRIHLYMGRTMPPADASGAADPFVIFRIAGQKIKSSVKYVTLNPSWFETLEVDVNLPPLDDDRYPHPGISALVYDSDDEGSLFGGKDLMGRAFIPVVPNEAELEDPVTKKSFKVPSFMEPKWYDMVWDATGEHAGFILVGYMLIPKKLNKDIPQEEIIPPSHKGRLSMVAIGLRNLISSIDLIPLKRISLKFDVQGDSKHASETDKHNVKGPSCNIFEIKTIDVHVPLNLLYSPVLSIYVFDHLFGFLGTRLVGLVNIPLQDLCKLMLDKKVALGKNLLAQALMGHKPKLGRKGAPPEHPLGKVGLGMLGGVAGSNTASKKALPTIQEEAPTRKGGENATEGGPKKQVAGDDVETERVAPGAGATQAAVSPEDVKVETKDEEAKKAPGEEGTDPKGATNKSRNEGGKMVSDDFGKVLGAKEKMEQSFERGGMDNLQIKAIHHSMTQEDLKHQEVQDKINGKTDAQKQVEAAVKKKVADQQKKMKEELKKQSETESPEEKKKKEELKKKQEEMDKKTKQSDTLAIKDQIDPPPSDAEEDLNEVPIYMRGRDTIDDEFEDKYIKKLPFDAHKFTRGQARGKASMFSKKTKSTVYETGILKNILKIRDLDSSKNLYEKYKQFLKPVSVKVRLYVLKGRSLTPMDGDTSDPYLVVMLAGKKIVDKESLKEKQLNPGFFRYYDLETSLPGACTLTIQVWDDDGFLPSELIGETTIDLETRYFAKEWLKYKQDGTKYPVEERTLLSTKSACPQGILQCWTEIYTPKEAKAVSPWDIAPPPRMDFELRVVVWGTRNTPHLDKTTDCNDLFATGVYNHKEFETDTHWRCRAKGSFNWRMKWPMKLPIDYDNEYGMNILAIQLWNRDIITADEMLGEIHIDISQQQFLKRVYKRKAKVQLNKYDEKHKKVIDKWWIAVAHPDFVDKDGNPEKRGEALISIEIVPMNLAKGQLKNGHGRDSPNVFPMMPAPTGRISFDLFSPWKMIKELLGPKLARKICCYVYCFFYCILAVYLSLQWGGSIVSAVVALA